MSIIERFRLWLRAARMGFPWNVTGMYIYAAGTDLAFARRWDDWRAFARANCFGDKVWGLYERDGYIASYELVRCYRRPGYSSFGDYAVGDTGQYGDLRLLRIDYVPPGMGEKLCEHGRRLTRFCCRCADERAA